MSHKYEQLYRQSRHALGAPTKAFVDFFASFDKRGASVLDLGCGQGRDALFIARLGHAVTAVDLSPTGIQQLREDAAKERLAITAIVSDIRDFVPCDSYDIVLIDRTLHMLPPADRIAVLQRLLPHTVAGGFVLIADETPNIPALQAVFEGSVATWSPTLKQRGYFFVRRDG